MRKPEPAPAASGIDGADSAIGVAYADIVGTSLGILGLSHRNTVFQYQRGILGLSHRNTVFQYQRRYDDMPQPAVDLGAGRVKLWLRPQIERWATRIAAQGRTRSKSSAAR